jgi:hypothetical protein
MMVLGMVIYFKSLPNNNGYDKYVILDGSTINNTIIDSTFNKPGGKYYV